MTKLLLASTKSSGSTEFCLLVIVSRPFNCISTRQLNSFKPQSSSSSMQVAPRRKTPPTIPIVVPGLVAVVVGGC